MNRRFLKVSLCSLVVVAAAGAPVAAGDGGPSPGVMQGWDGVAASSGQVRYVTLPTRSGTIVETVRIAGGRVESFRLIKGNFGIPLVTNSGDVGGLSLDGRVLVLGESKCCGLRKASRFVVLATKRMKPVRTIVLSGDFSYDALSPDGATLYLIQHVSAKDFTRYLVRAYDLRAGRLFSRIIADRREHETLMRGYPVGRVSSTDGAWVYTLYQGAEGKPFIHSLDAIHRQAVCLDLDAWKGSQDALWKLRLTLSKDERQLMLVRRSDGARVLAVDAPG